MTEPAFRPDEEDDLLAAEYVTGLLDLANRSAVETRMHRDTAFAARITGWELRLAGLNDDYAEVPAPDLLRQIEARLFPTAAKRSLWSGLWAWGAGAAAAVALVAYLTMNPAAPDFTATLAAASGELRYEAVVTDGQLTITRVSGFGAGANQSHQLWIIAGNNLPVSLGLLPEGTETISLPGAAAGAILAITVEPLGGSTTGQPTTAPIVAGPLTAA